MKYIKSKVKFIMIQTLFIFFGFLPIQKKIVISSYGGQSYGDNGKYIISEFIKQDKLTKIIWLVNSEELNTNKSEVKFINIKSIRSIYELATAKIWIDNKRKDFSVKKRKKQFYIQTWHGGIALKKIEKDAEMSLEKYYLRCAQHDSNMADLLISNSDFCTNMYNKAFWYDKEILECGSPRNDILVNGIENKRKQEIKLNTNIPLDKKILIYAPTFRNSSDLKIYDIDFECLSNNLEKKFGGEWLILLRLHPNIAYKSTEFKFSGKTKDMTRYPDFYELLAISDALITDYSSSMFDFMITKKPIFLYARDIESYKKERDFYFDFTELPFSISETNNQLNDNISKFNITEYESKVEKFSRRLGMKERGTASKQIVDRIKEIMK